MALEINRIQGRGTSGLKPSVQKCRWQPGLWPWVGGGRRDIQLVAGPSEGQVLMSKVNWAPSPGTPPLTPGGEPRDGVGSRHQLASEDWLSVQGQPPSHTHTLELGPGTQFLQSNTLTTHNKKEQKRSSLRGDRGKDESQPVFVLLWKLRNKLVWSLALETPNGNYCS